MVAAIITRINDYLMSQNIGPVGWANPFLVGALLSLYPQRVTSPCLCTQYKMAAEQPSTFFDVSPPADHL